METWHKYVLALLRGGVKAIPVAGELVAEVLAEWQKEQEALVEQVENSLQKATRRVAPPGISSQAAHEIEQAALAAGATLQPAYVEQLRSQISKLLKEDDSQVRRGLALKAGEGLTELLLEDSAVSDALARAVGGSSAPGTGETGILVAGRYRVEHEIGKGGMGAVYAAWDQKFDKLVALKLSVVGAHNAAAVRARFKQEAKIGDRLGMAAGFARTLDWGKEGQRLYLVQDLIRDAQPLELRSGTLPERLGRLVRACGLVAKAHQQGVLHRDLKPANFLQEPDGTLHLTDFGLAKIVGEDDTRDEVALTATGTGWGTPQFMPPEQYEDVKSCDQRADVFALGVMLFYALTGEYPYDGTIATVCRKQARVHAGLEPVPFPRQHDPAVPLDLEGLCGEALALEREARIASVAQFQSRLSAFLDGSPADRPSPPPAPTAPPKEPPLQEAPAPSRSTGSEPCVMAIVSKALFSKDCRTADGVTVGEGDVTPLSVYKSKNRNLMVLGEGGDLFLVTVRPPDERLWLVAVLKAPTFNGTSWEAKPNTVPVTDITELRPQIKFASGKGITKRIGALGMSLQTPRVLTAADVTLLRGALELG